MHIQTQKCVLCYVMLCYESHVIGVIQYNDDLYYCPKLELSKNNEEVNPWRERSIQVPEEEDYYDIF